MNYKPNSLHIMYGLPGSGKTYLAMQLYKQFEKNKNYHENKVIYQSLDEQENYQRIQNFPDYGTYGDARTVIIDGYFPNLSMLVLKLSNHYDYRCCIAFETIYIHSFSTTPKAIEACLENDRNRRHKSSEVTIKKGMKEFTPYAIDNFKNLLLSSSSLSFLSQAEIIVVNHAVEIYPNTNPMLFISSKWKTMRDDPEEFEELDIYLEKYYPNCTFLQYKKLSKLIKKEKDYTTDYYDTDSTLSVRYIINITDIESILGEPE